MPVRVVAHTCGDEQVHESGLLLPVLGLVGQVLSVESIAQIL